MTTVYSASDLLTELGSFKDLTMVVSGLEVNLLSLIKSGWILVVHKNKYGGRLRAKFESPLNPKSIITFSMESQYNQVSLAQMLNDACLTAPQHLTMSLRIGHREPLQQSLKSLHDYSDTELLEFVTQRSKSCVKKYKKNQPATLNELKLRFIS
jgi:hypothetical protein